MAQGVTTSHDITSVRVRRGTLERIKRNKPFDSMSHEEFLEIVLDEFEESADEAEAAD